MHSGCRDFFILMSKDFLLTAVNWQKPALYGSRMEKMQNWLFQEKRRLYGRIM